jgi:hypothetical protein
MGWCGSGTRPAVKPRPIRVEGPLHACARIELSRASRRRPERSVWVRHPPRRQCEPVRTEDRRVNTEHAALRAASGDSQSDWSRAESACAQSVFCGQSSAARPSQRRMTTLCASTCLRGRTPPWNPQVIPRSHPALIGASGGENSLARIWHSYLIFAALRLLAAAGQTECSNILAGQRVPCCCGRLGFPSAQAAPAVSGTAPDVVRPGSCTGLDLRFLVAGPGFEPGKTVVGDFTDLARYCPGRNIRVMRQFGTHWTCQDLPCGMAVDSRRISWDVTPEDALAPVSVGGAG